MKGMVTKMIKNPILKDSLGDPFVMKDGADYYLTATCQNPELGGHTFQCYHSTDLENWSEPKTILDFTKHVSWGKEKAWAPTMAKVGGHYYFSFCADQQIGIAVGEHPMGEFRDILGKPLVSYEQYGFQTIDPCLFVDDDGTVYLFFGQGKCYFAPISLSPDKAEFLEEPVSLSDQFYWQRSITTGFDITVYNEAPDLIKIGDRYLFSWAIYDVRDPRYAVRYAWADNVRGPYIQPVNDDLEVDNILIQGHGDIMCTGHACIQEYKGEYYIFYGRYKTPHRGMGREMCCDKVVFTDGDHVRAIPGK